MSSVEMQMGGAASAPVAQAAQANGVLQTDGVPSEDAVQQVVVVIYRTHTQAEGAIKRLQRAGFDMRNLSIIGKDYHSEEQPVGYYNTGDRMKFWGKLGAFWGGLCGLLFGSAVLFIPAFGHLVVLGPLVSWLVNGLAGAAIFGGVGALGGALASIGIPRDSVIEYEAAVKADKFLVLAHGAPEEVARARRVLEAGAETTALHGE